MSLAELPSDADLESLWRSEYRKAFAGWLLSHRSEGTRKAYAADVGSWLGWCAERGLDAVEPGRGVCKVWVADQLTQGVAAATVVRRAVAVKQWHLMLTVEALRGNNDPWLGVKLPRVDDVSSTVPLQAWEVARLVDGARVAGGDCETAVLILATMGLRASEVAQVVPENVSSSEWGLLVTVRAKGGKLKVCPIPGLVLDAYRRAGRWPCEPESVDGVRKRGRPMGRGDRHRVAALLDRAAERAGLKVHPHQLRHWFITTGLAEGVPLHRMQDSAGHVDPKTTQRYNRVRVVVEGHAAFTVADVLTRSGSGRVDGGAGCDVREVGDE